MTTPQSPINSGFGAATTADEVIKGRDLSGKVAIVTGGASGIGVDMARALISAGANVVVPARDLDKAKTALKDIPGVELALLDLADPASIDAFAKHFLASGRALHILLNNAGIMATPFTRDGRGYETQFATNHLGHFHLTARLWPALVRARGARVISVSSRGHSFAGVDFDDLHFERRPYDRWVAYGQSKTANILFAVALDARAQKQNVRAFSLHPGRISSTNLKRYMSAEEIAAIQAAPADTATDSPNFVKTIAQGAATNVWCATSPMLDGLGGVYCENCDIAEKVPADSKGMGVRPYAIDPDAGERLWHVSEKLTGISFTI